MIQSVHRALQILTAIAASPDGLGVGEIAGRVGLKAPTAHHLLATLQAQGFVERVIGPTRYRIGPAVVQLASVSRAGWVGVGLERAVAEVAAAWPGAIVVYCELVAGEVVTRLRRSPDLPGQQQRPAHQAMPPYTSTSALCVAAFASEEDRAAIARRHPLSEFGSHRWPLREQFDAYLDSVRAIGHVADCSDGLIRVSVPVMSGDDYLLGALGVCMAAPGGDGELRVIDEIVETLEVAAAQTRLPRP